MARVRRDHLLDVGVVVRLGELHRHLPVVVTHARVHGRLNVATLQVGRDRLHVGEVGGGNERV